MSKHSPPTSRPALGPGAPGPQPCPSMLTPASGHPKSHSQPRQELDLPTSMLTLVPGPPGTCSQVIHELVLLTSSPKPALGPSQALATPTSRPTQGPRHLGLLSQLFRDLAPHTRWLTPALGHPGTNKGYHSHHFYST